MKRKNDPLVEALVEVIIGGKVKAKDSRLALARFMAQESEATYNVEAVSESLGITPLSIANMWSEMQDLELGVVRYSETVKKSVKIVAFTWTDAQSGMDLLSKALAVIDEPEDDFEPVAEPPDPEPEPDVNWPMVQKLLTGASKSFRELLSVMVDERGLEVYAATVERALLTERPRVMEAFDFCQDHRLGVVHKGVVNGRLVKPHFVWADKNTKFQVSDILMGRGLDVGPTADLPIKPVLREEVEINGKVVIFIADAAMDQEEFDMAARLMEKKLFSKRPV